MLTKTNFHRILIRRGAIEMLRDAIDGETKHFNDFIKLKGIDTKKYFSPKTISQRLKELTQIGILERVVSQVKQKNVVGYKITEKGLKTIELYTRFEEGLEYISQH